MCSGVRVKDGALTMLARGLGRGWAWVGSHGVTCAALSFVMALLFWDVRDWRAFAITIGLGAVAIGGASLVVFKWADRSRSGK